MKKLISNNGSSTENMQKIYFTVGPTQLYPTVPKYILEALSTDVFSKSHTGEFFTTTYRKLSSNLRELFDIPLTHHIFFTGSSTESMHSIISSTVKDKSLHLITGGFSEKFYKAAVDLRKKPESFNVRWDEDIDLSQLDIPRDTELLCITENDTSIGVQLPLSGCKDVKAKNPSMLIAVDVVSSIPFVAIDYSYIDIAFFSVHKGLGLPAGLGILIANEQAIEKARYLARNGVCIGGHHSLATLAEKESSYRTPETPNVFDIFLLEKITSDLLTTGLEVIRADTKTKAKLIYNYFDMHPRYKPLVKGSCQSQTIIVVNALGNANDLVSKLAKKGFFLSRGYRPFEEDHLRIANFPAHTVRDVRALLKAMDSLD